MRRIRQRLESGVVQALQDRPYDRRRLQSGSVIPSQHSPAKIDIAGNDGRQQPDERWQANLRREIQHAPWFNRDADDIRRQIVHPGTLALQAYNGVTRGMAGGFFLMRLVLQRHPDRKRFILCNPDVGSGGSGHVLYYSYKNSPNALLPIYPGQTVDESGSEVSPDDIWIASATAGDPWIAYEGRLQGEYV